ncbi:MAG: hypothetical protein H6639_23860 [Caldilineaceae bacterium]|nr:hypothetical protein [Caldilineaceae bacterium]
MATQKTKKAADTTAQAADDAAAATKQIERITADANHELAVLAEQHPELQLDSPAPTRDLAVALMVKYHPDASPHCTYSFNAGHNALTLRLKQWPQLRVYIDRECAVEITNRTYWSKDTPRGVIPAAERNWKPFWAKRLYTTPTAKAVEQIARWLAANGDHVNKAVASEIERMKESLARVQAKIAQEWSNLLGDLPMPEEGGDVVITHNSLPYNATVTAGQVRIYADRQDLRLSISIGPQRKGQLAALTAMLNDVLVQLAQIPDDVPSQQMGASALILNLTDYDIRLPDEEPGKIITLVLPEAQEE